MLASLRIHNFRLFFFGQLISLIGFWAQIIAQDWLVLELTDNSASTLGVVTAYQFTPVLLFTLFAGILADRCNRRVLLIVVMVGAMTSVTILGILVTTHKIQLWHIFVFAFLTGTGNAFEKPIRKSLVPELVSRPLVGNAVALNAATFNGARLAGPAIGGISIAVLGAGTTFLFAGASYIAVIASLLTMRAVELNHSPPAPRGSRLREGARFIWAQRSLLVVTLMGFVVGTLAANLSVMLSLLARVEFHASAARLGLLTSALGLGAVVGAVLATRSRKRPSTSLQLGHGAGFGATVLLLGGAPSYWLTAAILVVAGALFVSHNTAAQTRLQLDTPAHLRGRVMSLYLLAFFGGAPVGAAALGSVGDHYGPRAVFVVIGTIILLATVVLAGVRAHQRRLDAHQWSSEKASPAAR